MSNDFNPYLPENEDKGSGFPVTITEAKFETYTFDSGDKQTRLAIKYISDGKEKERFDNYSLGKGVKATEDGENFVNDDGSPAKLKGKSNYGRFIKDLAKAGYDVTKLYPKVSALRGTRFGMNSEDIIDFNTKQPSVDKNGYTKRRIWPVKFLGYTDNRQTQVNSANIETLATTVIREVASKANGKGITRNDLVRGINEIFAARGEDSHPVVAKVLDTKFLNTLGDYDPKSSIFTVTPF